MPRNCWYWRLHLVAIVAIGTTSASIVYVAPNGIDQSPCGATLQTACATLGFAITSESSASKNIIDVAAGVYTEAAPEIEFSASGITYDLTIRAVASAFTPPTIDRGYKGRFFTFGIGTGKVSITGLRFYRGGWTTASGNSDVAGGLMRFTSSDGNEAITFKNCIFEANRVPVKGNAGRAAVASVAAGSPTFKGCKFINNWSGIASCAYMNGQATPLFEDCVFQDSGCLNDGWGGTVVPEGESAPLFRRCVFRNNTCDYGGAVDDGGTARPRFESCSFVGNSARGFGGAYYGFGDSRSTFKDCVFTGNRVPKGGNGGDYYLSNSVHATFEDCLFDPGENPIVVADGASGTAKDNSTLTMIRSIVRRYRASQGAVFLSVDARGMFDSTVFEDNACTRGGAIYSERPTLITNCSFIRNTATEGGAIASKGLNPASLTIIDSYFEDNVAKNSGGAIQMTGPSRLTVINTRFVGNSALGLGGGAVFATAGTSLTLNGSVLTANTASVGGAVYAEGQLTVVDCKLVDNTLRSSNEGDAELCVLAAGTGGAIYSSLAVAVFDSVTDCGSLSTHLRLQNNVFRRNSAGNGGGGAVFVDKGVPRCVETVSDLCDGCSFLDNTAAYGADIATIASALTLPSNLPTTWELMTPVDVVVGAVDRLGQPLTGVHALLSVRVSLSRQGSNESLAMTLRSNASRVLRAGAATFKSLALSLPVTSLNNVDVPLTLRFSSDLAVLGGGADALTIAYNTTLLKCPTDKGLIRSGNGKCLVEASGDSSQLVAALVFSFILGGGFAFGIYWSYSHSSRVLYTLQRLATGIIAPVLRLAFEMLDVVSDVQTLVNLFLFDVSLENIVFVKAAYATLFAISLPPSVAVMKATLENVVLQWKRLHVRRVVVHHHTSSTRTGEDTLATELKPVGLSTSATNCRSSSNWTTLAAAARLRSVVEERSLVHNVVATPVVPKRTASMVLWDVYGVQQHLERQEAQLQRDLEYYQARSKYMQRVLVRLFTEDILLFVFNLYIYLANEDDPVLLQSRFRSSLEFSILISAMQVQSIVTWLHANKVGEVKRQLEALHALRRRGEACH